MGRYTEEIEAALESAAAAEGKTTPWNTGKHVSTATPKQIHRARRYLLRLIAELPDDLTIAELREELE